MAFNPMGVPFKLTAQEAGIPVTDYAESLARGFQLGMTPRMMADELLKNKLANQIRAAQAKYAEPRELAGLQQTQASTSHLNAQTSAIPYETALKQQMIENQKIQNKSLPEKLRQEAARRQFSLDNPGFENTGLTGEIARYIYLKNKGILPQSQESSSIPHSESPGANYVSGLMRGKEQSQREIDPILQAIVQQKKSAAGHESAYARALADAEEIKKMYGENSPEYRNATAFSQRTAVGANEYQQKRTVGFAWATAPANAKTYMVAQAAGMGLSPDTAINAFSKGKTIEDLAKEHGFNPDELPEPDFLPTTGNITRLKERQAALKELEVLSKFTREKLGPYSRTIFGYSPKQVMESIQGKNDKGQAEYLAARALAQEENLVRLTVANARGTIPAIRGIATKAMNDMNAFRPLVNEKVWTQMQEIIDKKLGEAMNATARAYKLKGKSNIYDAMEKSQKIPDFKKMTDEELQNYVSE